MGEAIQRIETATQSFQRNREQALAGTMAGAGLTPINPRYVEPPSRCSFSQSCLARSYCYLVLSQSQARHALIGCLLLAGGGSVPHRARQAGWQQPLRGAL